MNFSYARDGLIFISRGIGYLPRVKASERSDKTVLAQSLYLNKLACNTYLTMMIRPCLTCCVHT